jgi:16S rRNA (cytidine1402-2'-O)-methyltransferase
VLPRPAPGRLYVVATPIGNLEDITLRALRVLRDVRVIAAEDTRRTAKLLAHAGIGTPMVSVHAHNEVARLPALLDRLRQGEDVALVTDAGTPLLSTKACRWKPFPVPAPCWPHWR